MGLAGRVLDRVGGADGTSDANGFDSIRSLLLLYAAAQAWNALLLQTALPSRGVMLVGALLAALGLSACFAGSMLPRFATLSSRLAVAFLLLQFTMTSSGTTSHLVFALWCVLFLALAGGEDEGERVLATQALRWTAVLVLVGCGVQKVLAGSWFQGDFLSFAIAAGAPLGRLFEWSVPAAEVARLRGLDMGLDGAGPFRASAPMLVVMSNLVWMLELGLPALLLHPRTRVAASLAAIVFVVVFYLVGGREPLWSFAMASLLLLFSPKRWLELAFWPLVVLYLYVLGAAIGVLPGTGSLRPSVVPGRMHL